MILKYKTGDAWGFIDNVRQAAHKAFSIDEYVERYNKENPTVFEEDPVCFRQDDTRLPEDIIKLNKSFMVVCKDLADEGINRHAENLLLPNLLEDADRGVSILLYIEDCKEYDAVLLVTNQNAYLMNDKGQTIERLN